MTRPLWSGAAGVAFTLVLAACGADSSERSGAAPPAPEELATVSSPVAVSKTFTKKVYVHWMPWFESKATSGNGTWGQHWTMANQNPDQGRIAAYAYPLIGPYGSGDKDVIEYQLLLMKYAGVDGVLIDWPGTLNCVDYPKNKQNAEALIAKTASVGLEFAIVYEDHNLSLAPTYGCSVPDRYAAARADMSYLQSNYFSKSNYIRINNAPLLMDFGPQTFTAPSDWTNIFSVLSPKPTFLTLWYQQQQAQGSASGEYPWIYSDFITGLTNFYNNRPLGVKFGVAYPGFNPFYQAGGWGGPTWTLPYNGTGTFGQTVDLAKNSGVNWIQLATWNDYGEGSMIEPTREFGYGFLTTLQQKLGVPYSQTQLELVNTLFNQRKQYAGNSSKQAQLDQASAYLAALQPDQASAILNGTTPPPSSTISIPNPSFESGTSDWPTWSPNGTAGAAFSETYGGAHGGSYHLTHWSQSPFETWTYQTRSGLANGNYKLRAWVKAGGSFGFARIQVKTCASCTPLYTSLGTYSNWTQVETPTISVTGGYLEYGFHTQVTQSGGASYVNMDDVELVKL
ncbi:glycoside hydrolase family 71/99-like protein [Hyalangium versicolor]|uniref:glycoside hydrolase family 71/99-like protein n=1 Tax=Hyalangium versicolor TaxID=2861190 RepID=UPI001CD020E2|nr:glycoside hydrolase family 71/99-like protein [Hyalangium versicolor]